MTKSVRLWVLALAAVVGILAVTSEASAIGRRRAAATTCNNSCNTGCGYNTCNTGHNTGCNTCGINTGYQGGCNTCGINTGCNTCGLNVGCNTCGTVGGCNTCGYAMTSPVGCNTCGQQFAGVGYRGMMQVAHSGCNTCGGNIVLASGTLPTTGGIVNAAPPVAVAAPAAGAPVAAAPVVVGGTGCSTCGGGYIGGGYGYPTIANGGCGTCGDDCGAYAAPARRRGIFRR